MAEYYLTLKALHLIAVISWMAGMLYLPRLYVYHCEVPIGSDQDLLFQKMEHRLLRYIINPAMIVSFVLGIVLIVVTDAMSQGWLHGKLLLVLLLTAAHGFMARYRKDFVKGTNKHSAKFYRILNEVPTVLMIVIVFLAVLKPF